MNLNRKYYRWLIEIAIILVIIFGARLWMQRGIVTGIAPDISAMLLNGQQYNLYSDKRRPLLIHFWASWCPVCEFEQSNIQRVSEDKPVITIAMQSGSNNELKKFIKKEKISFTVINDEHGEISQNYNIRAVPVSFIINKKNKIEFVEAGYTTELGLRLRLWWAGL